MSDDKNIQDGRDRSRVDAHEDYELSYLEEKLNVDRAAIREAIEQVGNDRAKVEEYLTNNKGL
jgi:Spy/CpxP family protein refolding chaperone